jgi:hypothetical protein
MVYWALALAALASIAKLAQVPFYVGDAQYYLQAAFLWPQGQLALDASLVGDRHLVPLYYRAFLSAFGPSIDAISIALALLFFIQAAAAAVILFVLIESKRLALAAFCAFLGIAYVAPIWSVPFTDNIFLAAVFVLMALWVCGLRTRNSPLLFVALPLAAGLLMSVRGEALIYAGMLLVAAVVSLRARIVQLASFVVVFALATWAGAAAWHLWVPAPKPATYKAFSIFYNANHAYAFGSNGPASAEISDRLGIQRTERIGPHLFRALMILHLTEGPERTEQLFWDTGLETTFGPRFLDVVGLALRETGQFMYQPGWRVSNDPAEIWAAQHFSRTDWQGQLDAMERRLKRTEARRLVVARDFRDNYYPTAQIVGQRLGFISSQRSATGSRLTLSGCGCRGSFFQSRLAGSPSCCGSEFRSCRTWRHSLRPPR